MPNERRSRWLSWLKREVFGEAFRHRIGIGFVGIVDVLIIFVCSKTALPWQTSSKFFIQTSPGTVDTNSTIPTEWDMIVGNVLLPISRRHADKTVTRSRLQRTRYGPYEAWRPLSQQLRVAFHPCYGTFSHFSCFFVIFPQSARLLPQNHALV